MTTDLHIHTNYSDGEFSPLDVLCLCKRDNITTISITDHNNFLGSKEAISLNPYKDITIIPGIEMEAKYNGGQLHILGYNIDLNNKELNEICALLMKDNLRRIKSLVANLYEVYKIHFPDEELQDIYNKKGNIGRPEIAKLCIKYGFAINTKDAFKKFFKPIEDMTIKKEVELSAKECIEYIINASGVAGIAHPITLKKDFGQTSAFIKELKTYGLSFIEVYHSSHSLDYACQMLQIANNLNLLCSAGSDFHGPVVKPNIFIGKYSKNNITNEAITILTKLLR